MKKAVHFSESPVKFCRITGRHISTKAGRPIAVKGRQWTRNNLFCQHFKIYNMNSAEHYKIFNFITLSTLTLRNYFC